MEAKMNTQLTDLDRTVAFTSRVFTFVWASDHSNNI